MAEKDPDLEDERRRREAVADLVSLDALYSVNQFVMRSGALSSRLEKAMDERAAALAGKKIVFWHERKEDDLTKQDIIAVVIYVAVVAAAIVAVALRWS